MAASRISSEYNVRGVPVAFPFEPYPSQLVFMDRVIEALQAPNCNALLESPTGTGKTLCLLCASLAWREMFKAARQAQQLGGTPVNAQGAAMLKKLAAGAGSADGALPSEPVAPASFGGAPPVNCRIIYVSRTHGQLSQVVRELRNTAFRPNVSILGSRQQYCVHHDVKKVPAGQRQNAQCQKLVSTQSCQFYRNVMDHKHQHKEVLDAMDIEDLVKHGEKHKVCPYYLTRDTANDADVIFMPYNYLTDPASRKSLAHLWKDSIVIFDEAHNMESICSEAASFDLTATDIAMCIAEVDRCSSIRESGMELPSETVTDEELQILKLILKEFEEAIAGLPLKGSPPSNTFPGSYIFELFKKAGVDHESVPELFGMVGRTITLLTEAQGAGIQSNPSIKTFNDALEAVFKSSNMANVNSLYKVHVTEEPERKARRQGPQSITDLQPTIDRALKPGQKPRQIGYWCFSAGVTMKDILDQGVRNVLLASGTLSPMASWAIEMQMEFQVTLENSHVIGEEQLLAAVVKKGPSGATLNSSYKNRDNMQSVDDLGNLILNVCRVVPANSGVLVFFPSYAALASGTDRWKQGSVWDSVNRIKQIFVEPRESGSFKMAVTAYTDEVDRVGSNGAVLMAVCRGKMSEGIDFADRHGRAVIVTGIPFPAAFDPRVVLKRSFMDELVPQSRAEGRETVTGEQWYIQQAARAVNQAIGRVIRHRKDYGAILLCDERFASWTKQSLLSKWMKDKVHVVDQFGPIIGKLSQFFQKHKHAELTVDSGESESQRAGQVVIHRHSAAVVKARRQEDQKVATSFVFEQEYLAHKDKKRDGADAPAAAQAGLRSWMSQLDSEPSQKGALSGAANDASKPASNPISLADQLMSMRAKTPAPARPATSHKSNGASGGGVAATSVAAASSTPATVSRTAPRVSPTAVGGGPAAEAPATREQTQAPQAAAGGGASTHGDEFMANVRALLTKDEYRRFKKAMAALRNAGDEHTLAKPFDDLCEVLSKPDNDKATLNDLLPLLSRKLQTQMRTHLSAKGIEI